jgi:energy-converting hydrogenase Eha subunit G
MAENKQNERRFDEILKKSLKKHREPIRKDFAQELLAKIQVAEQQNALRKVILQEKVSLAAFILLPLAAIAAIFAFPGMVAEMGRLLTELPPLISQALITLAKQWQLLAYYALTALACLYAAYEVLRPEN